MTQIWHNSTKTVPPSVQHETDRVTQKIPASPPPPAPPPPPSTHPCPHQTSKATQKGEQRERERERETDRDRERQRQRDRERERQRQRQKQTDRDRDRDRQERTTEIDSHPRAKRERQRQRQKDTERDTDTERDRQTERTIEIDSHPRAKRESEREVCVCVWGGGGGVRDYRDHVTPIGLVEPQLYTARGQHAPPTQQPITTTLCTHTITPTRQQAASIQESNGYTITVIKHAHADADRRLFFHEESQPTGSAPYTAPVDVIVTGASYLTAGVSE